MGGRFAAGAAAAGARELLSPLSSGADEATQRFVSSLIGITARAIAGGERGAEIGYAVALSAEANNRQLHQKEIKWIERHAGEFARELYGDSLTPEQTAEAEARLAQQALRQVDKAWSFKLGSKTDQKAQAFLQKNNAKLFTVKDKHEFMDGSTDGEREISSYSQEEFDRLNSFYQSYVHRPTATNPEGSLRNANQAWANEKEILDALNEGEFDPNQAIRDFIPNTVDAIEDIPDTLNGAGNYVDAVLPTKNQERLDTLYGSHTDGSVLQANMATGDVLTTGAMIGGVGSLGEGAVKSLEHSVARGVDDALDIRVGGVAGKGEAGEVISRSANIPHIGNIPDKQLKTNIDETMGYIFDDSKRPPKKIRDKWGEEFQNQDADLPTQDSNGKFIEYKEYKVRPLEGGSNNNVYHIVVGIDGNYYYANTHYGDVHRNGGTGIPFYKAGKSSKEKNK